MNAEISDINKKLDFVINLLNDSILTKNEYLEVKKIKKLIVEDKTKILKSIDDV
ncbi:MAG TPA: hypothetical protein PK385_00290 [Spirochaetota bacterium]|nr:MAG: hypothetical protein BWX91_00063 [Spirochaetes bacterium ADurb.Bin133]HNZ26406.1 hypothetical protein [Spirochaetota bacterium]HOF00539.1 hypothetical protein [Spirochaetota bacterium]HOS31889.1 hypothetical protein [Spirochaetota bacterium]HOS54476.1 hypothetical protein [Spirochaetota bacterium]